MSARRFLALASLLAACDRTSHGDCRTSADAALACAPSTSIWISTNGVQRASGTLALYDTASRAVCSRVTNLSGDTLLAFHQRTLVAMNFVRDDDNVTLFDTACVPPTVRAEYPMSETTDVHNGNARDYLAVDPTHGYVARLGQPSLAIVPSDPALCNGLCGTIDLSAFAAPSPLPNPYDLLAVGSQVWVTLQRWPSDFSRWEAPGLIAIIDPTRHAVIDADPTQEGVQAIVLHHPNPTSRMANWNGEVLVATTGSYLVVGDGGLELVDPAHPERGSEMLLEETDPAVRGNIDAVLVLDADRLLVRIADSANSALEINSTRLQVYSRSARALVSPPWVTVSEWTLTEPLLARDGKVYVGDRGHLVRPSGLRIFNAQTGAEETTTPIDVGQEPYQLVERAE